MPEATPRHTGPNSKWMHDITAEEQTSDLKRWQPQPLRSLIEKTDLKGFYDDPRVQRIPRVS